MGLAAALRTQRIGTAGHYRQKATADEQTGDPAFGYPAKDQRELAAVVAG